MSEDISLIPYDRITNLQSDLALLKSQIANIETELASLSSSAVHKTGNENIDGVKTFNKSVYLSNSSNENSSLYICRNDISKNDTITENKLIGSVYFQDKNNSSVGCVETWRKPNGSFTQILSNNKNNTWDGNLQAHFDDDGQSYVTIPTLSNASEKSTKIGNTEWVTNRIINIMNNMFPDYSKAIKNMSFPYTAPANGVMHFNIDSSSNVVVTINGMKLNFGGNDSGNEGPVTVLLSKGDVISYTNGIFNPIFIPYKIQLN